MENRDRDKVSHNTGPTEAGDINRETSSREGKEKDSSADFGQSIGRSEELNSPEHGTSGTGRPASTGMGKGQNETTDSTGSSPGRH
jgi:hypothetical protein